MCLSASALLPLQMLCGALLLGPGRPSSASSSIGRSWSSEGCPAPASHLSDVRERGGLLAAAYIAGVPPRHITQAIEGARRGVPGGCRARWQGAGEERTAGWGMQLVIIIIIITIIIIIIVTIYLAISLYRAHEPFKKHLSPSPRTTCSATNI
jgi:hypothetical protein